MSDNDVDRLATTLWEAINDPDGLLHDREITDSEWESYKQVAVYLLDSGYGRVRLENGLEFTDRVTNISRILHKYHATLPSPRWSEFKEVAHSNNDLLEELAYIGYPVNQYLHTPEELSALPELSVLMDPNGLMLQKRQGLWFVPGEVTYFNVRKIPLPIPLMYKPPVKEEES